MMMAMVSGKGYSRKTFRGKMLTHHIKYICADSIIIAILLRLLLVEQPNSKFGNVDHLPLAMEKSKTLSQQYHHRFIILIIIIIVVRDLSRFWSAHLSLSMSPFSLHSIIPFHRDTFRKYY